MPRTYIRDDLCRSPILGHALQYTGSNVSSKSFLGALGTLVFLLRLSHRKQHCPHRTSCTSQIPHLRPREKRSDPPAVAALGRGREMRRFFSCIGVGSWWRSSESSPTLYCSGILAASWRCTSCSTGSSRTRPGARMTRTSSFDKPAIRKRMHRIVKS